MHRWTEKTVDRDSLQKLYVQMYSIIKEKIETREWPNGAQIPTEDELCRTYDVSKATVRKAVSELVRSGYLKKQQGKGTFVIYAMQDLGVTMKTKLTEDMFGEGVKARKEVTRKRAEGAVRGDASGSPREGVRGASRPLLYPVQARRERSSPRARRPRPRAPPSAPGSSG